MANKTRKLWGGLRGYYFFSHQLRLLTIYKYHYLRDRHDSWHLCSRRCSIFHEHHYLLMMFTTLGHTFRNDGFLFKTTEFADN